MTLSERFKKLADKIPIWRGKAFDSPIHITPPNPVKPVNPNDPIPVPKPVNPKEYDK